MKYTTYGDLIDLVKDEYGGYYSNFILGNSESRTNIRNQEKDLPEPIKKGSIVKIGDQELEIKNDCKKVLDFYDKLDGKVNFNYMIDGIEVEENTVIILYCKP